MQRATTADRTRIALASTWRRLVVAVAILCACAHVHGQSLEERLDEDAYLRGLVELRLANVLEQYIRDHPTSDAFRKARFEIATAQITMTDPAVDVSQRLASLDRLAEIRAKVAAAHADDPRSPVLLADQAADAFFGLLPANASGFAAILGRPTSEQRSIAQRAARDVLTFAKQAEQQVDRALRALESQPNFATDFSLQDQRRRLGEEQRDRRIPFLLGVGSFLTAELNTTNSQERQRLFAQAVSRLSPLVQESSVSPLRGTALMQARLYLGLAQSRLGEFDTADAQFKSVIEDPSSADAPVELFAAKIARVINMQRKGDTQRAMQSLVALEEEFAELTPANAFRRFALADVRYSLLAPSEGAQPWTAYTDLLDAQLGVDADAVRAAVFERLALASTNGPSTSDATPRPSIVRIAQADRIAQQGTPQALSNAATMLREVLSSASLQPRDQALALFALGRTLLSAGLEAEAAESFIELARQIPNDAQAKRAIDLGVALAARLHSQQPQNSSAEALLERALSVALRQFDDLPTIDQWRLLAARFELDRGNFNAASEALSRISSASAHHLEAVCLNAVIARERAAAADEANRAELLAQALASIDDASALLQAAINRDGASANAGRLQEHAALLRLAKAQTLRDLDRPADALIELERLEDHPGATPHIVAQTLRVRIECHQAQGNPEEAVEVVEAYLNASPDLAVAAVMPLLLSLERDVQALLDAARDEDALALAKRTLEPIAAMLQQRLDAGEISSINTDAIGQRLAAAYRLSGRCEQALTWYERLLAAQPDAQPLLLGRAECLFVLGSEQRLAQAMSIYKRIAAAGPDAGDDYWLAQLRMLQILDVMNRNTNQIVPRIDRLRQYDSEMGGERFRRGFETLRSKYAG